MKSVVYVVAACVLASGTLSADTASLSSGTSWDTFSSVFNPSQASPVMSTNTTQLTSGTPFWNNWSTDSGVGGSHDMNIGYMLTGTGGWAGTDVLGTDPVATAALGAGGTDPSSFTFAPNAAETYDVTLLGADSGNSNSLWYGTVFGLYYISGGQTYYDPLYGPGSDPYTDTTSITLSGAARDASSYGFYATVCYAPSPVNGVCPTAYTETYFTDSAMNAGYVSNNESTYLDAGDYNHFALFGLSSTMSNNFVIAFKDGPVPSEGLGDFNDVVIELSDPVSTPEPATFGIVGLGLIALGTGRRRLQKTNSSGK